METSTSPGTGTSAFSRYLAPWAVFDLDDTLVGYVREGQVVGISQAYSDAIAEFGLFMEALGFDPLTTMARQDHLDRELCAAMGFGDRDRFPYSFELTYRESAGERYETRLARMAYQLGAEVFNVPYAPLQDAHEVLQAVAAEYHVAIVTKGSYFIQKRKLEQAGFEGLFDQLFVLDHKDQEEWSRVTELLGMETPEARAASWAIGNSVKSDINPPLELGYNAIHLDVPTWGYEVVEVARPQPDRWVHKVNNLGEVINILL